MSTVSILPIRLHENGPKGFRWVFWSAQETKFLLFSFEVGGAVLLQPGTELLTLIAVFADGRPKNSRRGS